jgi:hypothetical protein
MAAPLLAAVGAAGMLAATQAVPAQAAVKCTSSDHFLDYAADPPVRYVMRIRAGGRRERPYPERPRGHAPHMKIKFRPERVRLGLRR